MEPSELVDAIVAKLSAEMADQVKSVQLIPHEAKVRLHSGFPIIGIMDGGNKPKPGKMYVRNKVHVNILAFQKIFSDNPGDSVTGTDKNPGVMKLIEKAVGILEEETFDYFDVVEDQGSTPTSSLIRFRNDNREITVKVCRLEYRKN